MSPPWSLREDSSELPADADDEGSWFRRRPSWLPGDGVASNSAVKPGGRCSETTWPSLGSVEDMASCRTVIYNERIAVSSNDVVEGCQLVVVSINRGVGVGEQKST